MKKILNGELIDMTEAEIQAREEDEKENIKLSKPLAIGKDLLNRVQLR
jgi:hypothetical protein